jgi:hypothetical protein
MTPTISATRPVVRRASRQQAGIPGCRERPHARPRPLSPQRHPLGSYIDWQGCPREVLARDGAAGSVLVVDRDAGTRGDLRLVAHLAADEPAENAALVCRRYIEDIRGHHWRCRRVTAQDAQTMPFAEAEESELSAGMKLADAELIDHRGRLYRLELIETGMSIPELRWQRHGPSAAAGGCEQVVSLRQAVASLESYEPLRTLTLRELALRRCDTGVSTTGLRAELVRVQNSPIVLNRGLREAVLRSIEREGLSMSEIAIRCGRIKRDGKGNESGETSWLARRLGLLPEAGQQLATPWIHSDVLALISRRGLGVSPREVELG